MSEETLVATIKYEPIRFIYGRAKEEMRKLRLKFKLAVVFLFYLNILGFTFGR